MVILNGLFHRHSQYLPATNYSSIRSHPIMTGRRQAWVITLIYDVFGPFNFDDFTVDESDVFYP